ncbi:MAG TPA: hypothetical protein VNK44_04110 [Candidatus Nitrosotenuis sp.]|nr:hypothetical protein [Candidatus Nitrosotenuis sp.]
MKIIWIIIGIVCITTTFIGESYASSHRCNYHDISYDENKNNINSRIQAIYGNEVSQRVADYVKLDKITAFQLLLFLANQHGISECKKINEKQIAAQKGGINQNIIDSINQFKKQSIKEYLSDSGVSYDMKYSKPIQTIDNSILPNVHEYGENWDLIVDPSKIKPTSPDHKYLAQLEYVVTKSDYPKTRYVVTLLVTPWEHSAFVMYTVRLFNLESSILVLEIPDGVDRYTEPYSTLATPIPNIADRCIFLTTTEESADNKSAIVCQKNKFYFVIATDKLDPSVESEVKELANILSTSLDTEIGFRDLFPSQNLYDKQIATKLIKEFEKKLEKKFSPVIKQEEENMKKTKILISELEDRLPQIEKEIVQTQKEAFNAKNDLERYGYGLLIASKHGELKQTTLKLEETRKNLSKHEQEYRKYVDRHNTRLSNAMFDLGLISEEQKDRYYYSMKVLKFEDYFSDELNIDSKKVNAKKSEYDDKTKNDNKIKKKTEKKVDAKKTAEKKKVAKPANKTTKSSDIKTTKTVKKATSEDCSIWASMYAANKDTVNSYVESAYGKEEVSKRLADYVTTNADVTGFIGTANEMAAKLVSSCGYNEKTIKSGFGGFNQNIIDSVEIYMGMAISAIR